MHCNIYDEYTMNIVAQVFGYIWVTGLIHARKMEQVTIINVQQANATSTYAHKNTRQKSAKNERSYLVQ